MLVLLATVGLLSLLHRDVGTMASHLVHQLHLNPEHRYLLLFLHAASHVTDAHLRLLAEGALAYAALRFIEAYGLWHRRAWAEWLAILSGCFYLPWEYYEVVKRAPLGAEIVLLLNVVIVLYLLSCRWEAWKSNGLAACSETSPPEVVVPPSISVGTLGGAMFSSALAG